MSKKAAVAAKYAGFKLVRTRKVAVIALEIPIEQAEAFVRAFGLPNPTEETWVGIAKAAGNPEMPKAVEAANGKTKKSWGEVPPAQQAGIACENEAFRRFLFEEELAPNGVLDGAEEAAAHVRQHCNVQSRADLEKYPESLRRWCDLYGRFEAWQRYGQ